MKVLKVFGYILAALLFCVGLGMYSVHGCLKHVVNEQAVDAVVDKLVDTTITYGTKSLLQYLPPEVEEQLPPTKELIALLPKEAQDKLEEVKESFAKDPQVNKLLQKYTEAVIANLGDEKAVLPDVNKDVEDIVKDKLPQVASAIGVTFSEAEVASFAQEISKDVDLQPLVEEELSSVRENITPQEKQVIKAVSFSQSQSNFVLSIVLMVISVGIVAMIKRSIYRWMPVIATLAILGGGLIFAGANLAKFALTSDVVAMADGVFGSLIDSGTMFFIAGIVLFIIYAIITMFMKHRKSANETVNV